MDIKQIKEDLINYFSIDLDKNGERYYGEMYVEQLLRKITPHSNSLEELTARGYELHSETARNNYAPLCTAFVDWILENYSQSNVDGKIIFLARDAIPYYHIAKELLNHKQYGKLTKDNIGLLYYTRAIVGEPDEISGLSKKEIDLGIIKKYLKQEGVKKESIFVDSGLYGSLYKKGTKELWKEDCPSIVFFYSKNPFIDGYLNLMFELEGGLNGLSTVGDLFANTIETLTPQQHYTPKSVTIRENGTVKPNLIPIENPLIVAWHHGSIEGHIAGVKDYLSNGHISVKEKLMIAANLQQQAASGKFTGFLWSNNNVWSKKDEFLAGWDIGKAKSFPEPSRVLYA